MLDRRILHSLILFVFLIGLSCSQPDETQPDAGNQADAEQTGNDSNPGEPDGSGQTNDEEGSQTDTDDQDAGQDPDDGSASGDDDPVACAHRPILFVHGMIDAGGTFAPTAMRFVANGYCHERIFAFDWNTVSFNNQEQELEKLISTIDSILQQTGLEKLDLIGHSAGAGLCTSYLEDESHAANIAHYVNIAGGGHDALPGGVATLNLSSPDDPLAGAGETTGGQNVQIPGADHLQVVTHPDSFVNMYRFFQDGNDPQTTEIGSSLDTLQLSGKVVTLAENHPGQDYRVEIYAIDADTGLRQPTEPVATFIADEDGRFGPLDAQRGVHYEFYAIPPNDRGHPVHYFREPFEQSNHWVYLRVFPQNMMSIVGMLLNQIRFDDAHTVLLCFSAHQSIQHGRDTLFADDQEISNPTLTAFDNSTIAVFLFDKNGNRKTDGNRVGGLFERMPFLEGMDMYIESAATESISVRFNGRRLHIPRLPSASQGVVVASFD